MTTALLLACMAFILMAPWGQTVVDALLRRGIGKRIRQDEPDAHQAKQGTATMGGLYFLAGATALAAALALGGYTQALLVLLAMLLFGLLGAYDDLRGLKDVSGVGWLARFKFSWQWIAAMVVSLAMYWSWPEHRLILPISGRTLTLGGWFVPIAALLMVYEANAVNLADGMDGLAGGAAAIAYLAYGVLCGFSGQEGLALFCFGFVGALCAFLWFNVNPARMFMGDVGSQSLGAGLAAVAMLSGHWLLLFLIGVVFLAEALSVMIQVSYFKYTKRRYGEGRRIFRMSPLHYHYELGGWSEVQVTMRFWIVTALAAAMGIALGIG